MTGPDITVLIAAREQQMQDTCTVTRPGTDSGTLDDDAMSTADAGTPVYAGKCTVALPSTGQRGRTGTVDDQAGVPNARILRLPNDSPGVLPGDLVEVTASTFSPGLVGDKFVVIGEEERSYATHRRYLVRGSSWLSS